MNDDLFNELVASVREGVAIMRNKTVPSRTFVVEDPNVKHIRSQNKLSQRELAALLGVSIAALSNWENDGRMPRGPARILLMVMERHPEVV